MPFSVSCVVVKVRESTWLARFEAVFWTVAAVLLLDPDMASPTPVFLSIESVSVDFLEVVVGPVRFKTVSVGVVVSWSWSSQLGCVPSLLESGSTPVPPRFVSAVCNIEVLFAGGLFSWSIISSIGIVLLVLLFVAHEVLLLLSSCEAFRPPSRLSMIDSFGVWAAALCRPTLRVVAPIKRGCG